MQTYIGEQKKLTLIAKDFADSEKKKSKELSEANSQLKHEVNFRRRVENKLTIAKEKALKNGIRAITDFDGIPESITADERKLKQILYNLLSNAVKFTPDKGNILLAAKFIGNGDKHIQDLSKSATSYLQISVEDSGIGLKRNDLERIFKPFEQVETLPADNFKAPGLDCL